ncbi:sensor histidine kinase [Georgenia muralis]|uniref:Signal transduction histidine-protein kinase/phosphatase MprB n=1 Tax=Georgenia muralis TaxID=154117 RepID=A0A3N4ZXZ0_9MICO|nr:ATP-binding protein [Georgenia muralis]RPF25935.1 signal transduction histidine kinase [Georgenia muralis]
MRRRATQMILVAVTAAVLILGVPMAVFGAILVWESESSTLDLRASSLGRSIERRLVNDQELSDSMLEPWVDGTVNLEAGILVQGPDGEQYRAGPVFTDRVVRSLQITPSGATVRMDVDAWQVRWRSISVILLVASGVVAAFVVGLAVARRQARKLSAPLIYLAASAEQVGSGLVRPRMKPTGIEEIDLVAAELARTSDRLAGRLAAERQFAADASHQLRTPLTALSMRLEEIEALSEQDEVREEAHLALEQTERLTGVVEDLLRTSRSAGGGTTEAVHLGDVFEQQREEWARTYRKAKRELVFDDAAGLAVLATPGSLAQVLATLLENALRYGAGATRVVSRRTATGKGVFVDVSDEGPGVDDELAPDIFTKHVSGGSGTGLGLALARDLVAADGGRLELSQRRPPVFTIFLNAVPAALDPDVVLPQGALVSVGRRRRRR